MILDSLNNAASIESLHPLFKKAFDHFRSVNLQELPIGKVELQGTDLYYMVSEINGKKPDEARLETHENYIDIQIPLTAPETIGWKATEKLTTVDTPYNPDKDITFFADKSTAFVTLNPGEFIVLYPADAHAPCIGEGPARKIVVKVKIK